MKHVKEKKRKSFLPVITVVLAIVVVVLLAMLLILKGELADESNAANQPKAEQAAGQEASDDAEGIQDVLVETPYCDLFIPADKAENMRYEVSEAESGCEVSFYGTVADKDEQWLYSFWFGEADESAFLVGQLEGEIAVSLGISDFVPDEKWSAEDSDELFAMQETMNYAIEKLKENGSFSEA